MQSKLIQETFNLKHNINNYKSGLITINNNTYNHPIIFAENFTIEKWCINPNAAITIESLSRLKELNDQYLIILGTGSKYKQISLEIIAKLNLSIEVMATKSACHTYTILAQEQRPVLAALIV